MTPMAFTPLVRDSRWMRSGRPLLLGGSFFRRCWLLCRQLLSRSLLRRCCSVASRWFLGRFLGRKSLGLRGGEKLGAKFLLGLEPVFLVPAVLAASIEEQLEG